MIVPTMWRRKYVCEYYQTMFLSGVETLELSVDEDAVKAAVFQEFLKNSL
jgi:hypothetical protein